MLRHAWVVPEFADTRGRILMRVQAFVVELGGRTVVVDPCVGNVKRRALPFWNEQTWPFLERFAGAGFAPERVDLVVRASRRRATPPGTSRSELSRTASVRS